MKYEYLIFNIVVLSGPLFFGSLKKFYFLNYWKQALLTITISAIPFLIWDAAVTNRHWFFADEYTLGIRIFHIPIEEIMFFFTVPYACLFTWQMVKKFSYNSITDNIYEEETNNQSKILKENKLKNSILYFVISGSFCAFSIISMLNGKEYTAIAALFFALSILFDKFLGAKIFLTKIFGIYFLFVSFFTLIFNGYLTWRPIVTYDEIYQLGFRIFTIPIEDFFFGYALLILSTSLFEKMITNRSSF